MIIIKTLGYSKLFLFSCLMCALICISANTRIFGRLPLSETTFEPAAATTATGETTIVIKNVNVVPMNEQVILPGQSVIVEKGIITRIGAANKIKIPPGALVIDGQGKYLMPGLIDSHIHIENDADLPLYTANGITTVLNLQGRPYHLDLRSRLAAGKILGPRLFTAGPYVRDLFEASVAVRQIRDIKTAGYDFIKIKGNWSPEAYLAAVAEAKRLGIKVVGHAPRNLPFDIVLQGKVENMAHIEEIVYTAPPLAAWYANYKNEKLTGTAKDDPAQALEQPVRDLAREIKKTGIWVIPTMIVIDNYVREGAESTFEELNNRPYTQYLDPITRRKWAGSLQPKYLTQYRQLLALEKFMVKIFQQEGVKMALGTDATNRPTMAGYSIHQELELMVESGLTPYEALRMGTINGANFLDAGREIGTIEPGKRADLVLLAKNPLADIRNASEIEGVVLNGKWLSKDVLIDHLNELKNSYANLDGQVAAIDRAFKAGGGRAAVSAYREMKSPDNDLARYVEAMINSEGYLLLGKSLKKEAIEVFKINVESFPNSSNAYDSLGEAYMLNGDTEPAIKNYEKSLELNPQNTNAADKLKQLREKKQ